MNKLSTGADATLGEYLKLTVAVFGDNSSAAKFLRKKIAESPNGEKEEVIADERQMLLLLTGMQS